MKFVFHIDGKPSYWHYIICSRMKESVLRNFTIQTTLDNGYIVTLSPGLPDKEVDDPTMESYNFDLGIMRFLLFDRATSFEGVRIDCELTHDPLNPLVDAILHCVGWHFPGAEIRHNLEIPEDVIYIPHRKQLVFDLAS